jgi:hypothetical protein
MEASPAEEAGKAAAANWYDAVWLAKYIEAKAIVARVAPSRLDEFVRAFEVLRPPAGYTGQRFVPGFFSPELIAHIRETIRQIPMDRLEMHEIKRFGRFVVHDWPEFTALQETLVERVSELAGEPVEPSYNFLSLYTKMGVCQPHLDAPSAKWTLDICIDQSEPWPISFSQIVPWPETLDELRAISFDTIKADPGLRFREEVLMPGDAILFTGTNQWHYRDALPPGPGKRFCELLFFHFFPRGAKELVYPSNWASTFGIPELAAMEGVDRNY